MRLTVKVEQKHIDEGECHHNLYCPIAKALNEQHPAPICWSVGLRAAARRYETQDGRTGMDLIYLPAEARLFVAQFDAGLPVEPFEFELTDRR